MLAALTAVMSVSVLGTSASGITARSHAVDELTEEPCAPVLTAPSPTAPKPAALRPPTNLRVIGGGDTEGVLEPDDNEGGSGPYVSPEEPEAMVEAAAHDYFNTLRLRADCLVSFHLRSQLQLDSMITAGRSERRIPTAYDATMDAARFAIDPTGQTPNSGATDTMQKHARLRADGASLLVTWDLRIGANMRYVAPNGLGQHKSFRMDDNSGNGYMTLKANYAKATNQGEGVAELFFTISGQKWIPTGGILGSSETIQPALTTVYAQPDTWTRVWWYLEGNVGGASWNPDKPELGNLVHVSAWIADEQREPVQLLNRVPVYSPAGGVDIFRYEFDTSQDSASNGFGAQWNRNFVALRGISLAGVRDLLQRPVR